MECLLYNGFKKIKMKHIGPQGVRDTSGFG